MQSNGGARASEDYTAGELTGAFIGKRLTENLEAFKNHLPDIYECFRSYKEERFFLVYDSDGNINVYDRDEEVLLYSGDPVGECFSRLDEYVNAPVQRPYFLGKPCDDGPKDLVNYIHSSLMGDLARFQHDVLENILKDSVKKIFTPDSFEAKGLPDSVNTMFILSTGLGFDIEKLYLDRDIRNFIVLEPCLDAFYISIQLIDWKSILDKSFSSGTKISFLLGEELLSGLSGVVSTIGRHNVSGAFLYSGFYLEEFGTLFKDIKNAIGYSYLSGFGFYDDSRYSLSHTLGNIKNDIPMLSTNRSINKRIGQESIPAFIVGNGPSLDDSLDYIREHQGKVAIFGCGSSLKSLMSHDIIPDYFVELERTASVPFFIKASAEGIPGFYDKLKKIRFIGVSQVHPATFELFEKRGQILKDTETGTMMAYNLLKSKNVPVLPRIAPTCVHTAVTMATLLGYRDIYFFGTDMGTVDLDKHHSVHSVYSKVSEELDSTLKIKGGAELYDSNFDDKEVYSSGLYPMFKRELENIVCGWKENFGDELSYYNCSDGAFIEGTVPLRQDDIEISHFLSEHEVDNIIDEVFDLHFSCYPYECYDRALEQLDNVKLTVDKVCSWAQSNILSVSSIEEALQQVDRFGVHFHSKDVLDDEDAWVYSLFDGSLLYALSMINSTAQLPADSESVLDKVNDQFESFRSFFSNLKDDFRENCLEFDKEERYVHLLKNEA